MTRRVAITGVGLVSPLGHSMGQLMERLYAGESSIKAYPEWQKAPFGFATALASPVVDFEFNELPRKTRRTMSRVAGLATMASRQAIEDAGLTQDLIENERTGISYGSTMGGTSAIRTFYDLSVSGESMVSGVRSTTFPQIMSHTCAANIAINFKIPGKVIASCTACAASTQSIGFGYEAIKYGQLDRALVGGAEELEASVVAVFDVMGATSSSYNDRPDMAPRPFSTERDGIVVGEGAGTLVLEEWQQAKARGARIYGEISGFYTNNDASHMTNPSIAGLISAMKHALIEAKISPEVISYVNAHGTGTQAGDRVEALAISEIFGKQALTSSLKGHFGHLMGACGVIETIACLGMLADKKAIGTRNLTNIDPEFSQLNLFSTIKETPELKYILKNSFAFGGINACLILKGVNHDQS